MAPHSSTLAWKIPWTQEPCRLQSMRSLRVGQDWATSLSLFTFMHWRRKWQPTPLFLPVESQGQRSLVEGRLWGHTESDTTDEPTKPPPPPPQQQHDLRGKMFLFILQLFRNLFPFILINGRVFFCLFCFCFFPFCVNFHFFFYFWIVFIHCLQSDNLINSSLTLIQELARRDF